MINVRQYVFSKFLRCFDFQIKDSKYDSIREIFLDSKYYL